MEAATQLFADKGYTATRTADIARGAGITARTLFRYFPSKAGLYQRVMFPAVLAATMPREFAEAGKLFDIDPESFRDWHRRALNLRARAVRAAAPQYRLMLAALMTDPALRRHFLAIWKKKVWYQAVQLVERYQNRKQLRSDVKPERIARAILSLNLGYIVARALLAPEVGWRDGSEIDATVDLLLAGAAKR